MVVQAGHTFSFTLHKLHKISHNSYYRGDSAIQPVTTAEAKCTLHIYTLQLTLL